jgi:hypothetical protein
MQGKNRKLTSDRFAASPSAEIAARTVDESGPFAGNKKGGVRVRKMCVYVCVCVCVCVAAVKDPDNLARRVPDAAAAVTSTTFLEENLARTGPAWGRA